MVWSGDGGKFQLKIERPYLKGQSVQEVENEAGTVVFTNSPTLKM